MSDPFTTLYDALWSMLEAHTGFTDLVKVGNRVKFTGEVRDPVKPEINTADLPEVRLVPLGGDPHLQRTSNGTSVRKRFGIEITTGDKRVDAALFPVEWEIFRAMSNWASVLTALTWNSKTYVKLCRPLSMTEGESNPELNRGISGWSLVWACEVELWFTTADMLPAQD